MTDFIQAILTGFFTGIGVVSANWFHDKYIKKKLDLISKILKIRALGDKNRKKIA